MYKKESMKAMERQRRGNSEKIILTGEATKRLVDWAGFLSNNENKAQLIKLLVGVACGLVIFFSSLHSFVAVSPSPTSEECVSVHGICLFPDP